MCGILGVISKDSISKEKFSTALSKIQHRGPDGFGIWSNDEQNIMFGHRRLSIIDLSDNGKQPMIFADRYVITFNGEIYNYLELKKDLEKKGVSFKTQSDTEVLLALYATEGATCLNKLNGMWAFAIYDWQEHTIFFSRDRMGKKPFFYYQDENQFVFASEMKAIYPFMKKIEVNDALVAKASKDVFCYEATEHCLIKNIKRFPAASFGIFKNGHLQIHKYWDILENKVAVSTNYNEQVEHFKSLFIDACKLRMRSDVTVGTALSGGIDSSATISTMAYISNNISSTDYSKDWQHAFVASFPNTVLDETAEAKKVVDKIGINATYLNIDPLKDIDKIFYYTYLIEDLYLTSPIPFIQLYGAIKQNGTTVTLDGHGSDELFGGYMFDAQVKLQDDFPNLKKMMQTKQMILDGTLHPRTALIKDIYPDIKKAIKSRFKKNENMEGFDNLNTRLFQSSFETILPTLLRNYDRYSMINGVEIRMPFLDYRIVEFAFSIPSSSKIRNGFSKAIVRDAMKGLIPETIRTLKKKTGFNSPFVEWAKGPLKEWLLDEVHSAKFNQAQYINPTKVRNTMLHLINDSSVGFAEGEYAWTAFMPYVWEKSLKYI